MLWALATMKHMPVDDSFLNLSCGLFQATVVDEQANERDIAHVLWALSKLRHAPGDDVAVSMINRTMALCNCRIPSQQPSAKASMLSCLGVPT